MTSFLGRRRLRTLGRAGISAAILFLLIGLVLHQRQVLPQMLRGVETGRLALSILIAVTGLFIASAMWYMLLKASHASISFRSLTSAYLVSNLTKYVPGFIWPYAAMVAILATHGLRPETVVPSLALWQGMMVITGLVFGAGAVPVLIQASQPSQLWTIFVLMLVVLILVLSMPAIARRVSGSRWSALSRFGATLGAIDKKDLLATAGVGLGMWAFYGLAFFEFCSSFEPLSLSLVPWFCSVFALSFVIGFLTPFAPAGLGVREGVLTLLLSQMLSLETAAFLAVSSRLWLVLVELIGLLLVGTVSLPGRFRARRSTSS